MIKEYFGGSMFVWLMTVGCFDSIEHEKEVIAVDQNARIDKLEQKIRLLEAKLSQNLEACSVLELNEDGDIVIEDRNLRILGSQEGKGNT